MKPRGRSMARPAVSSMTFLTERAEASKHRCQVLAAMKPPSKRRDTMNPWPCLATYILYVLGDRIPRDNAEDNIYTFDSGPPDYVLIDASERKDCIARFINDSDYLHAANCRPVQFRDIEGLTQIAFYTTRSIQKGEELRYNYMCEEAPWKHPPESLADGSFSFSELNISNLSVDIDTIDLVDLNCPRTSVLQESSNPTDPSFNETEFQAKSQKQPNSKCDGFTANASADDSEFQPCSQNQPPSNCDGFSMNEHTESKNSTNNYTGATTEHDNAHNQLICWFEVMINELTNPHNQPTPCPGAMTNDNSNSESLPTPFAGALTNDNANSECLPTPFAGALTNDNANPESLPTPFAGALTNDNANSECLPTPFAGALTNDNANSESRPTPFAGALTNDNSNSAQEMIPAQETVKTKRTEENLYFLQRSSSDEDYEHEPPKVAKPNRPRRDKLEQCLLCYKEASNMLGFRQGCSEEKLEI